MMLRTYGWMPCWRIVFSTFLRCMSFYTASVIFDRDEANSRSRHVGCAPESGSKIRVLESASTGRSGLMASPGACFKLPNRSLESPRVQRHLLGPAFGRAVARSAALVAATGSASAPGRQDNQRCRGNTPAGRYTAVRWNLLPSHSNLTPQVILRSVAPRSKSLPKSKL
jgi:hypothetical protein